MTATVSKTPTSPTTLSAARIALRAIRQELQTAYNEIEALRPVRSTWTPVIQGSSTAGTNTYSVQSGIYWSFNKIVFFKAQIIMTAKDAAMAGNISVSLPIASASETATPGVAIARFDLIDFGAGYSQLMGQIPSGSAQVDLWEGGDNIAATTIAAANIAATTRIYLSGTYFKA